MITGKKDFWRRFLVIQGAAVTVGWYAAVVYDFCAYGRLCHLLVRYVAFLNLEILLLSESLIEFKKRALAYFISMSVY